MRKDIAIVVPKDDANLQAASTALQILLEKAGHRSRVFEADKIIVPFYNCDILISIGTQDTRWFAYSNQKWFLSELTAWKQEWSRQLGLSFPLIEGVVPDLSRNKVTAICPTYNRRKYLPQIIRCFLSQTYTNSELVIVDDSEEGAADCIPVHSRIHYVRLRAGQRFLLGEKRNLCCELATGAIIIHFDDDDWQAPTRIATQVEQLESSGKQVLSYYNILYWNEDTEKIYRCWPNNLNAPHGATLCYRKAFWEKNKFSDDLGEDTRFGFEAARQQQMVYLDAQQQIVVRIHEDSSSKIAKGNVSQTAKSTGKQNIPTARMEEIPAAFFVEPSLAPSKIAMNDLVVAVVQGLGWPALRSYANSLVRTGFTGTKLLLVANITEEARANLLHLEFKLVDFNPIGQQFITHGRFVPILRFLEQHRDEYRYVVWSDVRDLVFQENPSPWLEQNLSPHRLLGASECWQIKNQPMNDKWIRETFASLEYAWLREEVACCGGTLAGDAGAVYDALSAVHKIVSASPHANDQAALNYVLRVSPLKEITRVPLMKEGFAATVGAFDVDGFKSYSAGPPLTDAAPIFAAATATVYAPVSQLPFIIFHQYDRDDRWKLPIERKFQ